MTGSGGANLLDPQIFDHIKHSLEEETTVHDRLYQLVQRLNTNNSYVQGLLSRVHSTNRKNYAGLLAQVEEGIKQGILIIKELGEYASNYPYYKYHFKWSGSVQNLILAILFCGFLGGLSTHSKPRAIGLLLTHEDVAEIMEVPVNLKDRDAFHITIEEYLLALTQLTDELARLVINSVTLGDTEMAILISGFIKDLFAGFQLLNLKNDNLRRRIDAVKYNVKKVEDVIYDLSLRNLLPKPDQTEST